ncbi:hypothetical protein MASR2M70_18060 [Bacillota bacterium]
MGMGTGIGLGAGGSGASGIVGRVGIVIGGTAGGGLTPGMQICAPIIRLCGSRDGFARRMESSVTS